MTNTTGTNITQLVVGLLAAFVVLFRVIKFMIPMIKEAIRTKNVYMFFESLTMIV